MAFGHDGGRDMPRQRRGIKLKGRSAPRRGVLLPPAVSFCHCFSEHCCFCSEMQGCEVFGLRQKIFSNGGQRPPPTFAASRQRRDLIIAHPEGVSKEGGRTDRKPSERKIV